MRAAAISRESETLLAFERASCRWTLVGPLGSEANSGAKSDARAAVVAALAASLPPLSVREIAAATGSSHGAMHTLLHRMVADGEVERAERGRYHLAPDHPRLPVHEYHVGRRQDRHRQLPRWQAHQ